MVVVITKETQNTIQWHWQNCKKTNVTQYQKEYEKAGTVYTGDRTKNKFSLFGGQSGLQVAACYYMCPVREIKRNLAYRNTHVHKNICTRIFSTAQFIISTVKMRNNNQM